LVRLGPIRIQKGFESLAEMLAEQILDGDIKAGDLLPNERELISVSGLSRGSVREALRVLETQGLVATKLGRNGGRIATPPGDETFRRSIEFYIRGHTIPLPVLIETVEIFEPNLAMLAAKHRNNEDIAALKVASRKLEATTAPGPFVKANSVWHKVMAKASHNLLLIGIYEAFGEDLLNPNIKGYISDDIRSAVVRAVNHVQDAIIAGDAEAARRRMARHVEAYRALIEAAASQAKEGEAKGFLPAHWARRIASAVE
jgi:GntR family transcriptional repressor for pyruvate dehydrogenase complex